MGDPLNVIGIDIGGTKTHGVRMAGDRLVGEAFSRGANILSAGAAEAAIQLESLAEQLTVVAGPVHAVCAGAAGAGSDQTTQRVHALLRNIFPGAAIDVVHDVELVLAAAGLRSGIGVIAGTGSVAWGRTQAGEQARAGGWGYVLGDGGSAFAVARAAIQHTLQLDDAGRPPDLLAQQVRAAIGVRTSVELIECFYQNPSPLHWAEHARLVFARADAGDRFAAEIVAGAASDLAAMVADVGRRLRSAGPVVMAGGLLTHQPLLREALGSRLAELGFTGLRLLDRAPVHGAVALAQRRAGATR